MNKIPSSHQQEEQVNDGGPGQLLFGGLRGLNGNNGEGLASSTADATESASSSSLQTLLHSHALAVLITTVAFLGIIIFIFDRMRKFMYGADVVPITTKVSKLISGHNANSLFEQAGTRQKFYKDRRSKVDARELSVIMEESFQSSNRPLHKDLEDSVRLSTPDLTPMDVPTSVPMLTTVPRKAFGDITNSLPSRPKGKESALSHNTKCGTISTIRSDGEQSEQLYVQMQE